MNKRWKMSASVSNAGSAGDGGGDNGGKPRATWRRSWAWWTPGRRRRRQRQSRRRRHTPTLSDHRAKSCSSCSVGSNADWGALQVVCLCGTAQTGPQDSSQKKAERSVKNGLVRSWRRVQLEVRWQGATAANGLVHRVSCLLPASQHRDSCYVGKPAEWGVNNMVPPSKLQLRKGNGGLRGGVFYGRSLVSINSVCFSSFHALHNIGAPQKTWRQKQEEPTHKN